MASDPGRPWQRASRRTGAPLMMGPLKSLPGWMKPGQLPWGVQQLQTWGKHGNLEAHQFLPPRSCQTNLYAFLAQLSQVFCWKKSILTSGSREGGPLQTECGIASDLTGPILMPIHAFEMSPLIQRLDFEGHGGTETRKNKPKPQENGCCSASFIHFLATQWLSFFSPLSNLTPNLKLRWASRNSRRMEANSPAVRAMLPQNSLQRPTVHPPALDQDGSPPIVLAQGEPLPCR